MKIFYNSTIAKIFTFLGGYKTIMLFGYVFTEKNSLVKYEKVHELIHCLQFRDCMYIGMLLTVILMVLFFPFIHYYGLLFILIPIFLFYAIYGIEYLIRRCKLNHRDAYRSISFEKQAIELGHLYENSEETWFPYTFMSWLKYL